MRYVLGPLLLAVSVWWMYTSVMHSRSLDRYEFEHRNPAGVVEFENFEAADRHRRSRFLFQYKVGLATLGLIVGLLMTFA